MEYNIKEDNMTQYKFKMVMLGDSGAGKSCIIHRFIFNTFNEFNNATIGAQFLIKRVDDNHKIDIWDTAGQERFRSLIPLYIRGSNIVCIVISVDNSISEIELQKEFWLNYISQHPIMAANYKNVLIFNKLDLNPDFKIYEDDRFDYIGVVSCKTNEGISELNKQIDEIVLKLEKSVDGVFIRPTISLNTEEKKTESAGYAHNLLQYLPNKEYMTNMKCSIL
jgi:small GTP-binding protein